MKGLQLSTLRRSTSTTTETKNYAVLPNSNFKHLARSSSSSINNFSSSSDSAIVPKRDSSSSMNKISSFFHSLLNFIPFQFLHGRNWFSNFSTGVLSVTPYISRKLYGTLFGHRHGRVTFAVQSDPKLDPIMLLELDISTTSLVKEMSSGLLRIALECEKAGSGSGGWRRKLLRESTWTMYCNGHKSGYAISRTCDAYDRHVLNTVRRVSVGAGVVPVVGDRTKYGEGGTSELGELLYLRAKFERVVVSRNSEALYMINPDGNGGPELSVFLLRI